MHPHLTALLGRAALIHVQQSQPSLGTTASFPSQVPVIAILHRRNRPADLGVLSVWQAPSNSELELGAGIWINGNL
jgi:hypothetical protein